MSEGERISQPPRAPVAPDDIKNYAATTIFGQMANALKSGWNHTVTLTQTLRVNVPFAKTDVGQRGGLFVFSNESATPAGLEVLLTGGAAQANRTVDLQTTEVAVVNAGLLRLQNGGGDVAIPGPFYPGGNAFPAGHVAGRVHFRTDKTCWYYDDGTNWQIVGVEQTIETTGAPLQTINSTTAADVTGSSITVTTTGGGAIVVTGGVRCNVTNGTLIVQCSINGTTIAVDPVQADTLETTVAIAHRVAVTAAGAYTVKLTAKMAAAATTGSVTSFFFTTMAVKG